MADELVTLRSARRQSLRAVPGHLAFMLFVALGILVGQAWLNVPTGVAVTVVLLSGFGLAGDLVNIVYTGWKLAAVERSRDR